MHRPWPGLVLAFLTLAAPAAADDDWKDGCPFFDDPPLPVAGRFGISPVPDTALGPSRVALQYDRAQATVPIDPATGMASSRAFVQPSTNVVQLVSQLNLRGGPTLTGHYGLISSTDMRHLGNVGAALGYRYTDFGFDGAVRWGVAVRLGEDVSATAADCPTTGSTSPACVTSTGTARDQHHDDLLSATIRSPFNARWFAFDRVVSGVAEARVEMVGCHSPFVHLRVEDNRWRAVGLQAVPRSLDHSPLLHAIPITLAFGGYIGPHVGAAGEIGIELRSPTSVLLVHRVERYRALLDVRLGQHIEISLYAGAVSGDARGVELGVTVSGKLSGDDLHGDEGIQ
jgi:hypothetical protein